MNNLKKIIIMKCGTHASEKIDDIFKGKKEKVKTWYIYWGYGGTLCHPLNQIQPFCNDNKKYIYCSLQQVQN